ncbi:8091_t:CDS:2 [Paraglomus brasilianum]|uniref:8091_t:CDS:1 n=1 Tax=Paraglomus brasilianum TaxID=144538 RepID=A0A9N9C0X8_9GLOM|nr:8091_t:CDS:2 [Paraglomus brasilianum]
MDQAVFEVLTQALSSDEKIRVTAEQRIRELEQLSEYPVSLARMALVQDIGIPQRQISFAVDPHRI